MTSKRKSETNAKNSTKDSEKYDTVTVKKMKVAVSDSSAEENCDKPQEKQINLEKQSLLEGGPRVKFKSTWKGTLSEFFSKHPDAITQYEALCSQMSQQLRDLEELGATPVLPDGKVGGNAGCILTVNNHNYIICSKSGKLANTTMKTYQDFTIIESFNEDDWSCEYNSASSDILPTSDSPLHYIAFTAHQKLNWSEKPTFLLHGHAFETEEEAKKLDFPISTDETLFSTREDSDALLRLMEECPYPHHKVFIRKGHGFVLLGRDAKDAWDTFVTKMKPHLI